MDRRARAHPSSAGGQLPDVDPFVPMGPTPRRRMVIRSLVGPLLWLIALVLVAVAGGRTDAIGFGALIALGSLVVSSIGLAALRAGRNRLRRRYAEHR